MLGTQEGATWDGIEAGVQQDSAGDVDGREGMF